MARRLEPVKLEGVRILWPNLEGKEKQYNQEGDRNFHVVIPEDFADMMEKDGWAVKRKPPREDGDEWLYHLKVRVSYKMRAPLIVLLKDGVRTPLTEETVRLVDYVHIDEVDLIINASAWSMKNGTNGYSAYLQTMFVKVHVDALEQKYADIPDSEFEADDMVGDYEIPY